LHRGREPEEQVHLLRCRPRKQRNVSAGTRRERGRRRSREQLAVDARVERHHADRLHQLRHDRRLRGEDRADWQRGEALDVVDVEGGAQRLRDEGAALGVQRAVGDPALDDQTREQAGRSPRYEQMDPQPAASRQPEHRHLRRVTAERGDVLAHPLQRGDGIVQPEVRDVATDRARVEETERAEAVVRGDDHDVLLRREPGAIVAALRRRSEHERTTVEPDHHRSRIGIRGRPHVQVEASGLVGRARIHAGDDPVARELRGGRTQ
jgi:hypothetical protein